MNFFSVFFLFFYTPFVEALNFSFQWKVYKETSREIFTVKYTQ